MDAKEQLQLIRQWKREGTLGAHRESIVRSVQTNRSVLFCEKVGYTLKNVTLESWNTLEPPALKPRQLAPLKSSKSLKSLKSLKPLKIAALSSFTCDAYPLFLRPLFLCEGIWPEVYTAGYNQYVYELMNTDSGLYQFAPQIAVLLLDEQAVMGELSRDWTVGELERTCERKLLQLRQLLDVYRRRHHGLMVLHTIPLTAETYNTKIDYKTKSQISRVWRSFNNGLLSLSDESGQVIALDTEVLLQEYHVSRLHDPRLMQYGSFNLGEEALFALAEEGVKIARAVTGLTRKALVLDLDNTMWGGIIGDDGVNGVQLGDAAPGKIFVAFQKTVRQLKNQGVLLAISSKNEEVAVCEMFQQHPHMQIGLDDVAILRANWQPKPENIKAIAAALNIGLDSLVFVDDSQFERDLVRVSTPEVAVPEMPEDPAYFISTLLSAGWFNAIQLTATDLDRTSQYKLDVKREQLKQLTGSMEDYLHSLDIEVKLLPANAFHLPRLAQLTVRTNQFNMTTRRYQESEIERMVRSGRYEVLGFQTQDRFGDYGLIGCVLVEKLDAVWRIDNLMMSCRVFSRKIEVAMLRHVLEKAKDAGVRAVYGEYIPSNKNGIVKEFYLQNGFEPVPLHDSLSHDSLPRETAANPALNFEPGSQIKSEQDAAQNLERSLEQSLEQSLELSSGLQRFVHHLRCLPDDVSWIRMNTEEEVRTG